MPRKVSKPFPPDQLEAFMTRELVLPVVSSTIATIQYFAADRKLIVEFHSGGRYEYKNVGKTEARDFANANSKGKFHAKYIKGRKPFKRI